MTQTLTERYTQDEVNKQKANAFDAMQKNAQYREVQDLGRREGAQLGYTKGQEDLMTGLAGNVLTPPSGEQLATQEMLDKKAREYEYLETIRQQEANQANGMPRTYMPYAEQGLAQQGVTK